MSIEVSYTVRAECSVCGHEVDIFAEYDEVSYVELDTDDIEHHLRRMGSIVSHNGVEFWVCPICVDEHVGEIDAEKEEIQKELIEAKKKLEAAETRWEDWQNYKSEERTTRLLIALGELPGEALNEEPNQAESA